MLNNTYTMLKAPRIRDPCATSLLSPLACHMEEEKESKQIPLELSLHYSPWYRKAFSAESSTGMRYLPRKPERKSKIVRKPSNKDAI